MLRGRECLQLHQHRTNYRVDFDGESALSENAPKSACSFPIPSTTDLHFASSTINLAFSAASRRFSAADRASLAVAGPGVAARLSNAPRSRARRHLSTCD